MKKLFTSLLVVGLGISAYAATQTPIGTTDKQAYPQPNYAGVSTCIINTSTGTNAVECTTKPGIILQVFASSIANTSDSIVFRDSNTANTTSSTLAVYAQGTVSTPVGGVILPRFKNGLSVNALVNPGANGTWTIIYTTDIY